MKKFLVLSLFTLSIAACKKDEVQVVDNRPACEKNNQGTLKVDSYLADPYKVYLNGSYAGQVDAYGLLTLNNLTAGTYATRYVQASGYVFTPREYTLSLTVPQCGTFTATLQ